MSTGLGVPLEGAEQANCVERVARLVSTDLRGVAGQSPTQWSADGNWWWDGQKWIAADQLRRPGAAAPAVAPPSRALLRFAAFASLGLALCSYVMLPSRLLGAAPPTAIIAIAVGRAARHSLPKTELLDRRIAGIGIILAILPLALVIAGIMILQVLIGYMMITGQPSLG